MRTMKTLTRLRRCAGWFESSSSADVRKDVFSQYGSYNLFSILLLLFLFQLIWGIYVDGVDFFFSSGDSVSSTSDSLLNFLRPSVLSARSKVLLKPLGSDTILWNRFRLSHARRRVFLCWSKINSRSNSSSNTSSSLSVSDSSFVSMCSNTFLFSRAFLDVISFSDISAVIFHAYSMSFSSAFSAQTANLMT